MSDFSQFGGRQAIPGFAREAIHSVGSPHCKKSAKEDLQPAAYCRKLIEVAAMELPLKVSIMTSSCEASQGTLANFSWEQFTVSYTNFHHPVKHKFVTFTHERAYVAFQDA